MHIMYWNCRGFPWHAGVSTDELFGNADLILLGETWEKDTCALPQIPGYITESAAQKTKGHRGQGGVACIYKDYLQDHIKIVKIDALHRYIWVQITRGDHSYFIACCYIPHRDSVFYGDSGVDSSDPFGDIGIDVCHFNTLGEVILLGDMNARIGNMQAQPITWDEIDKDEQIELDPLWERQSMDQNVNAQGRALGNLMDGMHLLALNGMRLYPHTKEFTCMTASGGSSVVDYALVQINAMKHVCQFELGCQMPESDHIPIHIHLDMEIHRRMPTSATFSTPRLRMNHEGIYKEKVAEQLHQYPPTTWPELKKCMLSATLEVIGKKKRQRKPIKGMPHKAWFDTECKEARKRLRQFKGTDGYQLVAKQYHSLRKKKRNAYILQKQESDAYEMARNPKKVWDEMKTHKEEGIGTFTQDDMLAYVEGLYNIPGALHMIEETSPAAIHEDYFTLEEINSAIKHLNNGKACDANGLYAEMLKWMPEEGTAYTKDIINQAYYTGFPLDWQDNWIKALHKGGDRNILGNYRTIMVGAIMAKLFGCLMDKKLSKWAELNAKRAQGQAGFRAQHNTIDHLITLRVLMEESRRLGKTLFMCFVDFKKAFDTVPRRGLLERMQRIGVPEHLQQGVCRIYEQVMCKLKTPQGFSKSFVSNMGVKQGCPLSPTLFGIYIDELEELITEITKQEGIDGPAVGLYTVLILLYADDVILMAHTVEGVQRLLETLKVFCDKSGLKVNVDKTKMLSCAKGQVQIFEYEGRPIENVTEFKYLGIEIPSTYAWNRCMNRRLAASKRMYYVMETACNHKDIQNWRVKCIFFEAYVMQTALYGVELWGGSISLQGWNDFEKLQKGFIRRFMGVKITTPYSVLLLETGCLPIEYSGMIRVLRYLQKVKTMPETRLPRQAWVSCSKPKKNYKSKFLATGWMLDIRKWFKRWGLEAYLEKDEISWTQFTQDFKSSLWQKWAENEKYTKFEYYCKNIRGYNRNAFLMEENTCQTYLTTPMI